MTRVETDSADKKMIAAEFAASVLQPYVREERDKFKTHRWYRFCAEFCERWDQASFDPNYKTLPLSHFEPVVREVFSRPLP